MNNGTIAVKNRNEFLAWYENLSYQEAEEEKKKIFAALSKLSGPTKDEKSAAYRQYSMSGLTSTFSERWPEHHKESVISLKKLLDYNKQGLEINCGLWVEREIAYVYLGNPQKGFVFSCPEKWFEFIPTPDYSGTTPAELKQMKAPDIPDSASLAVFPAAGMKTTKKEIFEAVAEKESEIEGVKKEIDDVRHAKTGELVSLQLQIEALQKQLNEKKESLLAEMDKKMREMESQKEALENQIYLLDSQIFAIRCYAGETVNFITVKAGKPAPKEEPVVVHQKLRFLDEELGKLASLYYIQWSEMGIFEEFLRHSPAAIETFAPNEKCVVLIRLSRTGKELGANNMPGFENMLKQYSYFHGSAVGIIIRNGENIYLGWTDNDYVQIDDDLVNNVIDVTDEEPKSFMFKSEEEAFEKRQKTRRKKAMSDILSRVFVSNILQGVADHSDMLSLPAGTRFDKETPYIRYAVADAWLDDKRFGSFNEIIQRCNKTVSAGDMILTVQRLVPERNGYGYWANPNRAWYNARGRGDANRTHDCSVADCQLYSVNLVENDESEKRVSYEKRRKADGVWENVTQKQDTFEYERQTGQLRDDDIRNVDYYELPGEKHVYVSVEKTEKNWRREEEYIRIPRANFELYDDEYINLTHMNSVWLGWAITQKKLGNWKIGGELVDYAYGIRYLKKAMDFIREREVDEKRMLDAIDTSICENPEWPIQLAEWKIAKGVRKLTEYQAKRFANTVLPSRKTTKGQSNA